MEIKFMRKCKVIVCLLSFFLIISIQAYAQRVYNNPILPGYYPDPSLCRVGDDYYLVTSTFESFPGIPIFHSKDLVNWEQIGHVLDRPSQIALDSIRYSGGVFAPTIRYHQGVFYVINTAVGVRDSKKRGNYIVTATNPAGPWSEPYFLKNAPGIDPSLFFDDDGKVYYVGNKTADGGEKYHKHREIWLQELDLKTMQLVGERSIILSTGGALHFANNAEAPHLYKKDGYYYLMIAEGGTGDNHAVTVFRSKDIRAEYEHHKKNPILTNRHMGSDYPIQCIGHADMVETQNGEWWMVTLGCRPYGGNYYNLARETFLVPMKWENGWPVCASGIGHVAPTHVAPNLPEHKFATVPSLDQFDSSRLGYEWNFLRIPRGDFWSLDKPKGFLSLRLKSERLTEELNPSFVGRRQQHMNFVASTLMDFTPKSQNETAGIVIYQSPSFHYRMEVGMNGDARNVIRLTECRNGEEKIVGEQVIESGQIYLQISAVGQSLKFSYMKDGWSDWRILADNIDGRILNRNTAGGFTGVYLGMYASGNGTDSKNKALFDYFEYKGI